MATQYYTGTQGNENMQQVQQARRVNCIGSYGKLKVTSTTNIACCKYYAPLVCIYVLWY